MMQTRRVDLTAGALLVLLGLMLWGYTASFPSLDEGHPGPALFPRVVATGLLLAGLGLAAGSLRRRGEGAAPGRTGGFAWPDAARLLAGLGITAAFPWLLAWVGFVPALGMLCFVVALLLDVRLLTAVVTALLGALAVYGLFTKLLRVPL